MRYFKKIEGERVYLSPMNLEDANQYTKWLNDTAVTDGLGSSGSVMTITAEKAWIESCSNTGQQQFAIVKKENNGLLGNCGFNEINHLRQTATVGLFIGEADERNKGYGTEALTLLVRYGFKYLNLNNIMLQVYAFNESAINCYKKVGFKEIGRRREAMHMYGEKYDEVYMDILKKDIIK